MCSRREWIARVSCCRTPTIRLTVNSRQLSVFVDTGSAATLIRLSVLCVLGMEGRIKPCQRKLVGIDQGNLKVFGKVDVKVFVSENLMLDHSLVVVPDQYLSTDILMGADLIGRAPFFWDGRNNELTWGGTFYQVENTEGYSVRRVQWEEKGKCVGRPLQEKMEDWVHVGYREKVGPGQSTVLRVSNRKWAPGQIILLEKVKSRSQGGKSRVDVADSCYVVDADRGFHLPVSNPTRGVLRLRPGQRLATYVSVEENNITYLNNKGQAIGNKEEIGNKIASIKEPVQLCESHAKISSLRGEIIQTPSSLGCYVCEYDNEQSEVVGAVGCIENTLLPHSDHALVEGDRRMKLEEIMKKLDWSHLSQGQRAELQELILENNQLFILNDKELGQLKVKEAHIETIDPEPVRRPLYRHPENAREIIAEMVEDMLEKGVIEDSTALYLSPIVLVSKPDGSKRLCIDYRAVNHKIKPDIQPLPRLDELVENSAGKKFYAALDMKDAYFQVALDEESRDITTFSDGLNLYRFKRLPFGLSVSPAIFTRKMQEVLRPLLKKGWCKNYLDDVVLWASSFEELLDRLRETFQQLEECGLKLNVSKCTFGMKEIKFLGHIVSEQGIHPDPKNIRAVQQMNRPLNVKQVRRFIGMANFYRKHIENFALLANPLTNLMKKGQKFQWTPDCDHAFKTLKEKLVSAPILVKADQSLPFELHTDASDTHVGAALMQLVGKDLKPIGYYSKKLNATEKKYPVTDREAMGVVHACRFFHHYLWLKRFKVVTDHEPLTHVFKERTSCPRMSRYIIDLRGYNYKVKYVQGRKNVVPDMLSRPVESVKALTEQDLNTNPDHRFLGLTIATIRKEQRADKVWKPLIQFLEGGELMKKIPGNRPFYQFELQDEVLYVKREEFDKVRSCLVIPKALIPIACAISHNESHLGERKSVAKAKQTFYWPTMLKDVQKYVKSCKLCQQFKGHGATHHHWKDLPPVEENCQRVAIDLIDLHGSRAGYRYALTVVDHFSRFLRIYPLRNKTTQAVAAEFKKDICQFGKPRLVIMDNGGEFRGQEFREFCSKAGIKQGYTIPYHPRGNSVIERAHRTLKTVLAILSQKHPNTWPQHIQETAKALNEAVHTSLGTSPFFAFYGRHPNREVGQLMLPVDEEAETVDKLQVKELLKETMRRTTEGYLKNANAHRKDVTLELGSLAWVHIEEPLPDTAVKLNRKWRGPFKIVEVIDGGRAYRLENVFDGSEVKRAAEKLKPYVERDGILDKIEERFLNPDEDDAVHTQGSRVRRPPERFQDYVM